MQQPTDLFNSQQPAGQDQPRAGSVILTQLVNGRKIQQRYTGMSIREATQLFKQLIKNIQRVDINATQNAAD